MQEIEAELQEASKQQLPQGQQHEVGHILQHGPPVRRILTRSTLVEQLKGSSSSEQEDSSTVSYTASDSLHKSECL